jgi:hypothetical protein
MEDHVTDDPTPAPPQPPTPETAPDPPKDAETPSGDSDD